MRSRVLRSAALGSLLGSFAVTAALSQSPRVVSFGDSLSDNGNLYILSGGTQPPYPSRRFSSGLSFAEIFAGGPMLNFPFAMPGNVNAGSVNYAVGGSRTSGPMTPGPTTEQQIGLFLGTGGRFGATDIATLWAGANNIFQGIPVAAAGPATAQATMTAIATGAAADLGTQLRTLSNAGARTIVSLNLPNLSGVPAYNFGAGVAANALAGFSGTTFNSALAGQQAAAAAASPGTNIVSVDVAGLFNAVQGNPAAFGFADARQACIRVPSCLAGGRIVSETFAFWDDVHPTEAGYRLIAATVDQHLNAGAYASAFAPMGEIAVEDRRAGMLRALGRLDGLRGLNPGINRYYVELLGGATNADGAARRPGYDWRNYGVGFGLDRAFDNQLALTLGATVTSGTLKSGAVETTPTNLALDAALRYESGPFFGKLGLGLGVTDFGDTRRRTVGPLENKSSATAVAGHVGIEFGTLHEFGAFSVSPRARLGWIGASLDGFGETGVVAPLSIDSRSLSTVIAGAELRLAYALVSEASRRVELNATVGYERNIAYSGSTIGGRLTGNTALPFLTSLADPKGAGFILGAGASARVAGNLDLTADYKVQLGHGEALRHVGQAGLRVTF